MAKQEILQIILNIRFRDKVNKKDTLKVDMSLSEKLYRFRGKILKIEYDIPPNPIITRL